MSVQVPSLAGELYCPVCELSYPDGAECPKDGTRLVVLFTPVDSIVGRDIDGRFTILEQLGQGGMGAVYRASQHSVGREVAIKVVRADLASDPAVIKRFLREARLASKLSHPNAVGVLDFGQTVDGLFYLVMELVSGRTLAKVFEQEGVFDARRIIRVGIQICDALEAAHQLSIIHRDLKPANIMLLDAGRDLVKVLDFGLAKSIVDSKSDMTGSNNLVGTPAFMPPERAVGGAGDGRSDLYSLGCILFLLGSGATPFDSANMHELLMKQVTISAPPMVNVPLALATVIDRLLLKCPDQRYQTAAETREALDDVLAALPPAPRPARASSQPHVPSTEANDDVAALDPSNPSMPSLPIAGLDAAIPATDHDHAAMVLDDTLLAASLADASTQRRARWPWVVALSALVVAIGVMALPGGGTAARANVEAPIVVVPIPTIVPPMVATPTVEANARPAIEALSIVTPPAVSARSEKTEKTAKTAKTATTKRVTPRIIKPSAKQVARPAPVLPPPPKPQEPRFPF